MIKKVAIFISIILFIFLTGPTSIYALNSSTQEEIDSLEVKLILAHDSLKLNLINRVAEMYLTVDPMKSIVRAKSALSLAEQENDHAARAQALITLGQAHRHLLSDFDKALEYSFEALRIEETHNLHLGRTRTLIAIAEIYKEVGNNYQALEYYMQVLVLQKQLDEDQAVIQTLNAIGLIHLQLNNDKKALEYHKEALALSRKIGDQRQEANSIDYIAEGLRKEGKFNRAIEEQATALRLRKEIGDEAGIARSMASLGEIYFQKGETEKALEYYVESSKTDRKLGNKKGLAKTYNNIGALFIRTKEYERAINNLEIGLKYGVEENAKRHIRDSYELLYTAHSALEDYVNALLYKDLFIAISEFIYSEESERKIAEMQTKYEIDKKEDEIELLKRVQEVRDLQLAKQNDLKNFLIIALVLFAIIAILTYYLYRTKKRSNLRLIEINAQINEKNKALEELNATKDKFFSIISHDLKGPLNSLTSFSSLLINHISHMSKDEIQMLAKDLDKSVKGLFSLLENLLEWSRSQSGNIELKPETLDLIHLIDQNKSLLSKTAENKNIRLITPEFSNLAVYGDKNSINTILRNLISNALKFTLSGGEVKVEVTENQTMALISVIDNGVGMSPEVMNKLFRIDQKHSTKGTANEKGTGLGLILCKEFAEKNGGTISVESKEGQGSKFTFSLPKARATNYLKAS